jgi:hypothetical protein
MVLVCGLILRLNAPAVLRIFVDGGRFRPRDLSNAACWLEFNYTEASFMRNGMRRSRFPVAA